MARDIGVVRRYCVVTAQDEAVLRRPCQPDRASGRNCPGRCWREALRPGLDTLGCMLPNTPLHHLLLADIDTPIVLTSGNRASEPQCIANDEAASRLRGIVDYFLLHDRDIACRVDDSVVRRMGGAIRVLRRARGYAPAPLELPAGFAGAPRRAGDGGRAEEQLLPAARRPRYIVASHRRPGEQPHAGRLPAVDRAVPRLVRARCRKLSRSILIPNTCRPNWG